jgi:hypothetical protein
MQVVELCLQRIMLGIVANELLFMADSDLFEHGIAFLDISFPLLHLLSLLV